MRAYLMAIILAAMGVAVVVKLIRVQYIDTYKGKKWLEYARFNNERFDTIPATRGNIFSNDSSLLATSLPYYFIGIDTRTADTDYFEENVGLLARKLADRFKEHPPEYYIRRMRDARNHKAPRYVRLRQSNITHQERNELLDWPFFKRQKGGGGGKFERVYRRYEPFSPMASRAIGSLNPKTGKGLVGVEASFDKELSGKKGLQLVEVVEGGLRIPIGSFDLKPEPGLDVFTTLDMNIQDMAESALRQALATYQADYGCAIVMEVATGEIRAMANLTHQKGTYREVRNYALAGGTDPGSTFKLATLMAVAEETGMDLTKEKVQTGGGRLKYKSVTITDTKRGGHGTITAQEVLEKSSNIGTVLLAHKYFGNHPEKYIQYLDKFHLRQPTGIHMKGELPPYIKDKTSPTWSKVTLGFLSHGYEMKVTPLQILAFYNAVANNGYWVRPMIVKQIRNNHEQVDVIEPYVDHTPIASAATIRKVQDALKGVVAQGTARNIRSTHYPIAGKTGTAQRLVNGQYVRGRYYNSFAGYFPADNPKYSCLVAIDSPRGFSMERLYAGSVAAPVFKEIADRIFAYDVSLHQPQPLPELKQSDAVRVAGLKNDMQSIARTLGLHTVPDELQGWVSGRLDPKQEVTWASSEQLSDQAFPDLKGMALRDALFILENKGYKIRYKGAGKVVAQELRRSGVHKEVLLTLR